MNTRQEKVMNRFLIVTGAIEAGAGLALLFMPSTFVRLLLGTDISGAAILLARLASAALLALGAACWLARSDAQSRAARGLVAAMLVYNVGAAVVLGVPALNRKPRASCCGWRSRFMRLWPSGASRWF